MAVRVDLARLVEIFDQPAEWSTFISRSTGEIFSATEDDQSAAEEDEEEDESLPDWQREAVQRLRQILESEDWICVDDLQSELHEYRELTYFAESQTDPKLQQQLLSALIGKGAFRRVKDVLRATGLRDAWFAHRQRVVESLATDWLQANEFEIDRTTP